MNSPKYMLDNNRVDWDNLLENENINDLLPHLCHMDNDILALNPCAVHLLSYTLTMSNWRSLSKNRNAIYFLEQNLNKIDWDLLSFNENAIHLLEKYPNKIVTIILYPKK